jgi:uncharacterized protein YjbI with pentapeptide repeats
MTAEIESSPSAEPKKPTKLSNALVWFAGIATLALLAGVVGVVIYGLAVEPALFGFDRKKPWNYLDVFLVPVVVTVATGWLTWAQHRRQRKDEAQRHALEDRAEKAQRDREFEVENRRAQDEALEAYLDEISQLLTNEKRPLRRARPGDSLSTVARARTLTTLSRLSGRRKRSVLQFLYESGLVMKGHVVVDLRGADLSAADLGLADLSAANLHRAELREADLGEADLSEANLLMANLRNADLRASDLKGAHLHKADLSEADLRDANLRDADLREAHPTAAYLNKDSLKETDLRGAYLNATDLNEADLSKANLLGVDLSASNLHIAILRNANLRTADLTASILSNADLRQADLRGAYLSRANLTEADMSGAELRNADLRGAFLSRVTLRRANLSEVDLRETDLRETDLRETDLREADLTDASLSGVVLRYANLEGVVGISNEELEQQAASLEGTTMPDGQKYEDWLKSKGRAAEDGENTSSP